MANSPDVIVIGGGVIGCAIAYELAKRKVKVVLLERDQVGSGASNASAGMVAPLSDNLGDGPLVNLGAESFRMYSPFVAEIEEAGKMSVECLPSGIIRTAWKEEETKELREGLETARALGLEMQFLSGDEARKLEPLIGPAAIAATYSPSEPQLHPSRLVETLRRAALAHGAVVREQSPVSALVRKGSRVVGVRVADETIGAGTVVLATGSWACQASDWLGLTVPVYPVRGQVAYVNKFAQRLEHTVMHGLTYAVPKGDGTTLAGTTAEFVGFDTRVTVAGLTHVLNGLQTLLPSIGDTSINHTRAGLRPWSKDMLPVLGPTPGAENVVLATGHFRSGILLTPVTARMISDLITAGAKAVDFGPYSAARLAKAGA